MRKTLTCRPQQREVLRMPSLLQDSTDTLNPPTHSDRQIPCDLVDLELLVGTHSSCCEPSLIYIFPV